KMSPDLQEQFTKLYRDLLEGVYMDRLLSYKGQKINYVRQIQLSDTRAQVDTQVVTPQGQEIPMAYKLVDENGQWRVYDMVIENVSLAQNYRSQFTSFLQNKSFSDLLEQLRQKTGQTG
ncbi:MAG: ABC transporter substrate-binding protein, partial [Desulfosarcinaceae bacterium]